jgi:PAS domain S-box-containing protein
LTAIAAALIVQLLFLINLLSLLNDNQTGPTQVQAARETIHIGIAMSLLLALTLALVFQKRVIKPLVNLRKNTEAMLKSGASRTDIKSKDEITVLKQLITSVGLELAGAIEKELAIADYAMDLICSLDSNGRITAVSPAAIRLWGYGPEELEGRRFLDLVLPKDVQRTREHLSSARASPSEISLENQMLCRNGAAVHMLWFLEWSATERRLFCVGRDITAQKELELMKQQFVALVSHELRTPLNSIYGVLALLSSGALGTLSDAARDKLSIAERNIGRLMLIVNDLLDIEKLEAGQMQMSLGDTSLQPILESSVEAVERVAENGQVSIDCAKTEAVVFADSDRLVQVVINLLGNAIKYSPPGGIVSLSVSELPNVVEVRVTDQGRGIPIEYREAIFERFRQVEISDSKRKGGTGLGLAICKAIVEQHNGTIGVDSTEGQGSSFWFKVPAGRETH